ncbi:MAG: hypothetical protein IJ775_02670 [Muribaculaceae bacterium]|nr:hypothetical protein [Muribaculaceae bacterium]
MNTLTHRSSHRWRFMTLLVAAVIMVMPLSCRNSRPQDKKPQAIDSPYNEKAAMEVYGRNPQRAMLIVDSAEIVGNMSHFSAQFLRAKILSQSMVSQDLDSAYHIALTLADCDSVKENLNDRYDVMELLSTISRLRDDDENEQKWLNELAQVCREQGDEISALRTDAEVGVIMTYLGESEAGIKKLDDAIKKLDAQKTFNGIDACVIAMKRKIGVDFDGNIAEVISLSQRIIEKMDYYESHSAECSDGSYREPHADAASDYCNFYRTQAHGYLATAHALLDNKAEARKFLAKYEQSDYAQTLNGKIAVVEAWRELGDYDKVLSLYRSLEECHTTDTITRDFIKVLRSSAIAMAAKGNPDEGKIMWKRYSKLVQKYNDKLLSCKAHNYAARYHSDEQQLKIEENETDIKYMRSSIIASILAFLLALAFAIYFFRERSMMSLKNKALTSQISEANKYNLNSAAL